MSNLIDKFLKRPYYIISFLGLFLFLGLYGYNSIDRKLFPDSNRPEIATVIIWPGASAKDIASNVAVPIEKELYALDKIRRVYSSTIDEVSVIRAEFHYEKDIESAATDVANAISKIRSSLPPDIKEPQIHKITAATPPVITIGVSSKVASLLDVREICENEIKNDLLKIEGVSNVDIFGGFKKEILVEVDKKAVDKLGLNMGQVLGMLSKNDRDYAIGFMDIDRGRFLLKSNGKRDRLEQIKKLPITDKVRLEDIAHISYGHYDNSALYYGNGKPAIALSVQRSIDADVIKTIENVEAKLKEIKANYPGLDFEVTDSQKDTIEQSITNMFESLRDAIIMSTIVAFFFLASFRQVLVVLFTIPLVYASTVAMMYLFGIEFSVVTLTAIILALGLLLDDAVVVMENIERHYKELGKPIGKAVLDGTKEIMFADLSGTITTMVALFPIMFVGDYPQTVFRPLVSTLLIALAASYIISITTVPLLSMKFLAIQSSWVLKAEEVFAKVSDYFNNGARNFFAQLAKAAMERKRIAFLYFASLLILFAISARVVMPTVGQELMPPMDTGIVKINITMDPNLPIEKSAEVLQKVNQAVYDSGAVKRVSSAIGSEAGVLSIGSAGGIDSISITATYLNRFEREESIWDIEHKIREKIQQIPNIKYFSVFDYGATALSSIRGNVDVMLSSDSFEKLQTASERLFEVLQNTQGLVNVAKTWDLSKDVYQLKIDEQKSAYYGVSADDIAKQTALYLKGSPSASLAVNNAVDTLIRVRGADREKALMTLDTILIDTPKGKIPLSTFSSLVKVKEPSQITREGLKYTVDVYGFREKASISHIMQNFDKAYAGIELPDGVELTQTGDIAQFQDSAKRMVKAVAFGVGLIFFVLIPMFNSFRAPLLIIFSIPLTLVGASWILLLMDYHTSMPAMMGFILLSGIIVNNAILLIEFALLGMKRGLSSKEAMLESIKIRTRPVLMTAFATTAGMLPVALGWAIGLERLAPLGAVAIGGLMVGTFLTLVFIPILFVWIYKKKESVDF
ncbi:efflux RND transporter permease subunit [Hydrogenimonas thermophila]|uniref:Multidrug efflux pump subunit AcrB n=1 Tax=Hydrogenimonas thermophila TaxID=223786 RepID=A0A1I5QAM6_9BACT|nr:efflux RND transporter permease subunit [Hydrogenimonas thermophila]SFP43283.1 Multidrug efflux pump subunit AcrB [Hydrogenimonas thermophila]